MLYRILSYRCHHFEKYLEDVNGVYKVGNFVLTFPVIFRLLHFFPFKYNKKEPGKSTPDAGWIFLAWELININIEIVANKCDFYSCKLPLKSGDLQDEKSNTKCVIHL